MSTSETDAFLQSIADRRAFWKEDGDLFDRATEIITRQRLYIAALETELMECGKLLKIRIESLRAQADDLAVKVGVQ